MSKYQLLPPLGDDDVAALEASICAHGVFVPVEYDEAGEIIDGHHRVSICRKLGISDWPRIVRRGLSDSEKRARARELNLARRHLTTFQKRAIIEGQLRETPHLSNRALGIMLGVDHKTVSSRREYLETRGELKRPTLTIGRDGIAKPSSRRPLPPSPLLSDGVRLDGLTYYDVLRRIRNAEHDLSLLKAIREQGTPVDDTAIVREFIPSRFLAEIRGWQS